MSHVQLDISKFHKKVKGRTVLCQQLQLMLHLAQKCKSKIINNALKQALNQGETAYSGSSSFYNVFASKMSDEKIVQKMRKQLSKVKQQFDNMILIDMVNPRPLQQIKNDE